MLWKIVMLESAEPLLLVLGIVTIIGSAIVLVVHQLTRQIPGGESHLPSTVSTGPGGRMKKGR